MSLVIWHNGNLYADSLFQSSDSEGVEFSKVMMFKRRVIAQVNPDPTDMKSLADVTNEELKNDPAISAAFMHCMDSICGGFFVGNLAVGKAILTHIEGVVEQLHKKKDGAGTVIFQLRELIKIINSAAALMLIGRLSTVTLVLIGVEKLYEIEICSNGEPVNLKVRDHTELFGFGTGGDYLSKNPYIVDKVLSDKMHPSIAVQITMLQDKMSGGWIEWWSFVAPADDKKAPTFARLGIYQPRANEDMQELLSKPDGFILMPDFLSTKNDHLDAWIKIQNKKEEEVTETPVASEVVESQPEPSPSKPKKVKKHEDRTKQPRRTASPRRRVK